ncbi:MAG: Alpha/Beta hydrolase protein [Linnemannia gamsii]|nr:MAG: Alpha/Beta hydrolase protein [Linnemannia gamsii]
MDGTSVGPSSGGVSILSSSSMPVTRRIPTTNKAFDNIEILEHARHFVRLAIASYGSLPWVYFGYSFKVAPLNFVRFNSDRKNVMDYFKLKKEDMIVWHFDKRTALVPSYYIVRDPKYNALCIIIRGTFSITDAMTDLVCEYYPYKGGLVHKGIMDNARFVLERSGKDIEAALRKFNLKTIYCIGHSLGAGSASLLCSLLQDHFADYQVAPTAQVPHPPKFEVKAYLFAPPPIATPNLAAEWERTQISFINENDIVCRLSYGNALDLKELIKIGALESLNPAYEGLSAEEKLDRILRVLEKAQKRLQAVNDVPRLVTAGTVTYLHKIYEDTPVVKNKKGKGQRDSQFGLPDNWASEDSSSSQQTNGGGRARGTSVSSTTSNNPLVRSLSVLSSALSLKGNHHGHGHQQLQPPQFQRQTTSSTLGGSMRSAPIVTPYQAGQPAVRLESSVSLALSDLNERHKELQPQQPPPQQPQQDSRRASASLGTPVLYGGDSNERAKATESILQQSHQGNNSQEGEILIGLHQPIPQQQQEQEPTSPTRLGSENESEFDDNDEMGESDILDEDDNRTYTTTKPKKNGSKKKEIRIEFSDKAHFMAIPLRTNWLWHHFPQQYDSRIERALAWAKAHKEKEDKKQKAREARRQQQQRKA